MSEYVTEYKMIKDPLPGFIRYRKLRAFKAYLGIHYEDIAEFTGHQKQTVRAWLSRKSRQNITSECLQKVYDHFGGVNEDGESNFTVMRDF